MTYALDCLERVRRNHERVEVVLSDDVVIRCRECGHAVTPVP